MRNSELSTKISETQSSIDRINFSCKIRAPFDDPLDNMASVSRFENHLEIESKVNSANLRVEKLKLELDDLNG